MNSDTFTLDFRQNHKKAHILDRKYHFQGCRQPLRQDELGRCHRRLHRMKGTDPIIKGERHKQAPQLYIAAERRQPREVLHLPSARAYNERGRRLIAGHTTRNRKRQPTNKSVATMRSLSKRVYSVGCFMCDQSDTHSGEGFSLAIAKTATQGVRPTKKSCAGSTSRRLSTLVAARGLLIR